ncbi:CHY zinc finger protein [Virgibacillus ihumii]|uniref:CHY zinc finger protein n=1 Tax=Virgibacillus ihumii TaxID=2686091 RepID=UPI00157D65B7|nr:CHY zinc finger protein [Virgibacillus ihumii]
MKVTGAIDKETRCSHYYENNDIIAIKFYCCKEYFPCYQCHAEYGCGHNKVWPKVKFDEKAILCGNCKNELTINEYLNGGYSCPNCYASFNPGCSIHYHLYFQK